MLVDLARNDLGRVSHNITVKSFKDIHYYSHVIHMVSEVQGELPANYDPIHVMGQSFPLEHYQARQNIEQFSSSIS